MEEQLKIYDIVLNPESTDQGINFISFVERPAVELDFLTFSKEDKQFKFAVDNEQERVALGVIMLADTPIYRNNPLLGEHYVVFNKETIKQIVLKYFKDDRISSVNLNHSKQFDGAYLFQSYIVDRQLGINPPSAFSDIPDGSWIGAFKIENEVVWNSITAGLFNGFSIEGFFEYGEEVLSDNMLEAEMIEIHRMLSTIK